jgi:hypothetical protein
MERFSLPDPTFEPLPASGGEVDVTRYENLGLRARGRDQANPTMFGFQPSDCQRFERQVIVEQVGHRLAEITNLQVSAHFLPEGQ